MQMKSVLELLDGLDFSSNQDLGNLRVGSIVTDSRRVVAGDLFVAIEGLTVDGHQFIPDAVARGCAAIIANRGRVDGAAKRAVPCIAVDDSREILGELAARFYDHPAQKMQMIGITGTNGKTTTTFLVESIVRASGGNPGVIGTINYRYNEKVTAANYTTPEPVALHGLLADMRRAGVTHVIMEVSSHALAQKRVSGLLFDVALFTNLTRDHLDFHGSMEEYYQAKKKLFTDHLKDNGAAVIISETSAVEGSLSGGNSCRAKKAKMQSWGGRLKDDLASGCSGKQIEIIGCGMSADCEICPLSIEYGVHETTLSLQRQPGKLAITSSLVGNFNARNVLGAIGISTALAVEDQKIAEGIAALHSVPGRLERIEAGGAAARRNVSIFVDYAHTPDALENVLLSLRQICSNRLIVVFGCGGDRDQGKRAMMGEIAGRLADLVVITSDNSRSEASEAIAAAIEKGVLAADMVRVDGLSRESKAGYTIVLSRSDAIAQAIKNTEPGDVVAICGKGHETYQLNREGKIFFDDRQQAAAELSQLH